MKKIKKHLYIIIPCFNEKNTILKIFKKLDKLKKKIDIKIIIINDGSTDGTAEIIKKFIKHKIYKFINLNKNYGKGYAIHASSKFIKKNSMVVIQDADLEYFPNDLVNMSNIMINYDLKVLYGSRLLNKSFHKIFSSFGGNLIRIFANFFLTKFSNIINNQKLTDAHTCYKMFRSDIFKKLDLKENGFSFCPEVNTKLSNLNVNIREIPIKYKSRKFDEGKK